MNINLNKLLIAGGTAAFAFVIAFFVWWQKEIVVSNNGVAHISQEQFPKSPISGIACEQANRRPIAVMLAADPITRPLSGISKADIVFEMPVTPSGVTRMMAVYQCEYPQEIGSVRSAREDFIPLAASLGTVFVHWGGEREALKKLNNHILDNIDALVYETVYFYRKKNISQPHNGFTDFDKLIYAVRKLDYNMDNQFEGYLHNEKEDSKNIVNIIDSVSVDYSFPFNVEWIYDKEKNIYKRLRGDKPEVDRNNESQVTANVVVVMETTSKFISQDYLAVLIVGEGEAAVYQNGVKISGKWKKDSLSLDSKLYFYDNEGKEIEFVPGKIWVEIVF